MTATSAMNPARLQVPSKHGAASRTGTDSGLLIAVGLVRFKGDCMGYNARNDEIHENLERMRRQCEAYEDSLAIVRQFNARLSAENATWFWPTVAAALASKHHWLVIACDACDIVIDIDLTVKRRDPDAPIRVALNDVRCPRCNGHGRARIVGLSRYPSV